MFFLAIDKLQPAAWTKTCLDWFIFCLVVHVCDWAFWIIIWVHKWKQQSLCYVYINFLLYKMFLQFPPTLSNPLLIITSFFPFSLHVHLLSSNLKLLCPLILIQTWPSPFLPPDLNCVLVPIFSLSKLQIPFNVHSTPSYPGSHWNCSYTVYLHVVPAVYPSSDPLHTDLS